MVTNAVGTNEILINEANYKQFVEDDRVAGELKRRGLDPRKLDKHPKGSFKCASADFPFPIIPEGDRQRILDKRIKANAQLSDIRMRGMNGSMIPSRDQNGKGYCWAHSSTSAILLLRAKDNQPFADLSAYAVACIIKKFKDEGGFGAESLDFIAERGIPTGQFWPQKSMKKENNNDATWENAKLHRFEKWIDVKTKDQFITLLLMGIPVVSDFNWWGHSVCTMDLVSLNPFRTRIWNSWSDGWSQNGTGILEGSKALPDDMVAPYLATASVE